MSSSMTFVRSKDETIYRQNYQILNSSLANKIQEIHEYQVDFVTRGPKIVRVQSEMIGAATLITTETFNSNNCGLYPLFTEENEVVGT